MTTEKFVLAIDQGTTSTRAIIFNHAGEIVSVGQKEFTQIFPNPGWVEHNPIEIWDTTRTVVAEALQKAEINRHNLAAVGITNQRETTVVWNRETGQPVANAIVWQCRRTAPLVEELCGAPDVAAEVARRTGLVPDAYFSASKIRWILDNVPDAREDALQGKLAFGTVDSWLLWALTQGEVHATDVTNASRTMLFNIHDMKWDPWLLDLFDIPASMLPEVRPSSGDFGVTRNPAVFPGVPIRGIAGDQQAALFGQCCFSPGQAKNTYGTGCFLLMNTGNEACESKNGLVTTVAASAPDAKGPEYALEGSVFMAGALLQWLRDEMGLIDDVADTCEIARSVDSTEGVYIVPAFTGLGAPYWDAEARGTVVGLTRGSTRAHFVRAALESLAYQVHDLVVAMEADSGVKLSELNVDGGASKNDFLMQFQCDMLRTSLHRPKNAETTAVGAAYLAGLATGFWESTDQLRGLRTTDDVYEPQMDHTRHAELLEGWRRAVGHTKTK